MSFNPYERIITMNSVSRVLSKSQVFARHVVNLAVDAYGLSLLSVSRQELESLADETFAFDGFG